ncbi:uncharacterized protein LAESUDRAFT_763743 [Laetiporus sulphureus 93-53]|uniref:Uncharacterized protein n=1 Tax=Laetiporus sulphureus 93-53 TaxID=1314785 RepID=A0A165BQT4_9APHY|nr:uncharacterized protein LAESUDRAFT_763743 [Laetiporus sulphureus 93-53]KZT01485.1 hypothetical protein LAESUDRAFT_763743 [Laetiporus sulphureus 93-53]
MLDFFEPIDEAIVSFGETVFGFFGSNRNIADMNCDIPPIKFWIDLEGVDVIYVVVIDVERVLTILLDNISDYPASFSALMLPFLDVVAEVANHVLVNEGKLEFRYVVAEGFELEYEMLEVEDVVVVKLMMISFAKRKATKAEDPYTSYKHLETNKERGRLLTLASLGASSTDRQRATARSHLLLECYKPRKGRLTTGGRRPRPPPEIITSNAVPPIIVAPQPVRPLPNFVKVNTHARPIHPLPSKVRPTLHIETLKKQVSATRFRLQPILGAFCERIEQDKRKKVQLLASELDKVCADLYMGTREYTFVDTQVINTCCLKIGKINFKEIGKQQRLDEIVREIGKFEHLEDALRQSAPGEVPDHIREWVIVAMKLMVSTEVAKVYNVLRNKMYEHKKAFESLIQNNKSKHRLKEGMLQTEIGKLKDRILTQDVHMTVLNNEPSGIQVAMLDTGKEMMEIKAANVKLRHELASLKASSATVMQGQTSGTVQSHKPHIKIAEPPHYSGKGSLEDWL